MYHLKPLLIGALSLLWFTGCPDGKDEPEPKRPSPTTFTDAGVIFDAGADNHGEYVDAGDDATVIAASDAGVHVELITDNTDGGPESFWPEPSELFPITGQGTIAEALTSMEGESCFFESDRFLIINDVELLYWHWAGLGERRFDVPGGDLKGCVTLEDGTPMLITSESILLFDGFDWVLSPLSVILDGEVLNDTTHLWRSDAGDTFFFAFESGLSYWESGTIYDIDIPSLATQNASLRVGTIAIDGVEKGDGVWVASEDWVYALSPQGTSFDAYVLHGGGAIEEMAAYGAHHFAMVIDGDIHVHDGDERIVYRLPSAVTHVWGHPGRSDLLAGSSKPEWWIRPDGNLIQLTNLSSAGTWYLDTQGVMTRALRWPHPAPPGTLCSLARY